MKAAPASLQEAPSENFAERLRRRGLRFTERPYRRSPTSVSESEPVAGPLFQSSCRLVPLLWQRRRRSPPIRRASWYLGLRYGVGAQLVAARRQLPRCQAPSEREGLAARLRGGGRSLSCKQDAALHTGIDRHDCHERVQEVDDLVEQVTMPPSPRLERWMPRLTETRTRCLAPTLALLFVGCAFVAACGGNDEPDSEVALTTLTSEDLEMMVLPRGRAWRSGIRVLAPPTIWGHRQRRAG